MVKYYYIPSENKTYVFEIECESKLSDGSKCYLAKSISSNQEVWIYDDGCIEYIGNSKHHEIKNGYEINKPQTAISMNPNQYYWGGEVRDRRARSMAARPYYKIN